MQNGDEVKISHVVSEDQQRISRSGGGVPVGTSDAARYSNVLARISDMVNASVDTFTIVRQIMQEAAGLFGAERSMVLLYENGHDLTYLLGSGFTPDQAHSIEDVVCDEPCGRYLGSINTSVALYSDATEGGDPSLCDWAISVGVATLTLSPLTHTGNLLGFLSLAHNNRRNYAEDELLTLRTMSNLMALTLGNYLSTDPAGQGNVGKDRFLSALSHELRTPLTSIMGFTQIIRRRLSATQSADPKLMDQLEVLWTQAQRLNRLIDTFVDISNVERGSFAMNLGKVEIVSVLKKAVEQSLAQDRHMHEIALDTPPGTVWVHADGKRLEQVFSHLLSNALRYSPEHRPVKVSLEDHRADGKVLVSIADHGPGIPPDRLKHIFERFYQKDMLKSGGLGVGLYISKMILEAHGGHISIESAQDRGTVVSLTLPA